MYNKKTKEHICKIEKYDWKGEKNGYYKIQINITIRRTDNRRKVKKQVFEVVSVEDVNMLPLE